ncbi:AhpC/TSA family protein [Dyadobacter sp. CY261]|uniref:TlpA disulfide reductase family protein n=1 Tax=Dyadobacter sp. CY261 TaxID=2907203 RepID=UPI001F3E1209|nr:TlpA disulfide reductase family protein [Dyadobacter sp. CY261]MCF0069412.1 AhpC/TSA family protein [Dyadobacter sp. CY261]
MRHSDVLSQVVATQSAINRYLIALNFTARQVRTYPFIIISFCFIFNCVHAQVSRKTQNGFVLSGQLTKSAGKKIYLYERAFYKTENRVDSTKADASGKFVFRGSVSEPTYYSLQIGEQGIGFYIENTTMEIEGTADSLYAASVTGSTEEAIRQKYDEAYHSFDFNTLAQQEINARTKGDTAALRIVKNQTKLLATKERQAILALMKQYPLSTASVNQVGNYIASHQASDLAIADSLLKRYEASPIRTSEQVRFFRGEWMTAGKTVIGQPAMDFEQPDTTGRPIKLSSFRGQYVLVDFWASWCGPCREESPFLVKAYQDFHSRNFTILSVSLDKSKSLWLKAIAQDNLRWAHVGDMKYWNNAVAKQYAISSIPFNMLLDPEGKILALNLRGDGLYDFLQSNLRNH